MTIYYSLQCLTVVLVRIFFAFFLHFLLFFTLAAQWQTYDIFYEFCADRWILWWVSVCICWRFIYLCAIFAATPSEWIINSMLVCQIHVESFKCWQMINLLFAQTNNQCYVQTVVQKPTDSQSDNHQYFVHNTHTHMLDLLRACFDAWKYAAVFILPFCSKCRISRNGKTVKVLHSFTLLLFFAPT